MLSVSANHMKRFHQLSILLLCLFIQACSAKDEIEAKEKVWKAKLIEFEPIGKTKKELFKWQNENGVPLNSFPREEGIILETVEGDGWVCSMWHVYLSTETDKQGKISRYSVSSAGSCL